MKTRPAFPKQADDLQDEHAYRYEFRSESFRAGSYSSYNQWRRELTLMANCPQDVPSDAPFSELVYFSDCESVIGTTTAAKLSKDFADFQSKADERDDYFRELYTCWREAFDVAAINGAVDFH